MARIGNVLRQLCCEGDERNVTMGMTKGFYKAFATNLVVKVKNSSVGVRIPT